jgi:hypothetical protein
MFIARWRIDARFGHKQEAMALLKQWMDEVGAEIGFTRKNGRLVTGSIGALEATIESEVQVESLAALEASFAKLAKNEAHQQWGRKLEPHVVSGVSNWQIFRVIE